jgi:hydroxysqualene synthase
MSSLHGVTHYENFPVASVLTPRALRPAVVAIYRFARTADDLADEGDAPAEARTEALLAYRADLQAVAAGQPASPRWPQVFGPLAQQMQAQHLPLPLLDALLSAFLQDVVQHRYQDRSQLLDYCSRSANPVGRLLLHLYGQHDALVLQRSDAICTALQLINFWQDLSVDLARGRLYLPLSDVQRMGLSAEALLERQESQASRRLVQQACDWARTLMLSGAPLVHDLPGRLGWELRFVVQGGLHILRKIERMDHATLRQRPRLQRRDAPALLLRALAM